MTVATDSLPDDAGTLKAMLIAERVRNERLVAIIKELQRHRFGRRAETLPEGQMLLGLEDVEQVAASGEAEIDAANAAERTNRSAKRRMNRGSLPAHLPRVEMVVDIDDRTCPCCGNAMHRIGRTPASGLTSCRRSSACSLFADPNTPAGLARTSWCRRPRRHG
jgi:hypothetical protein